MSLQAETQFGLNFLQTLPAHNESLVFSPISIALVLSLLHTGAHGKTKEQIETVLLNGSNATQFVDYFTLLNKQIRSGKKTKRTESVPDPKKESHSIFDAISVEKEIGVYVHIANRIYLKEGFSINPTFFSTIQKKYQADAKILPPSIPKAVQEINDFVNETTIGNIPSIVSSENIENSISVLINAIYFKGYWLSKFPKRHTYDSEFTTYSGEKTMKTFMSEYGFCGDSSSDDIFHVIHLNYVDERFELSIFLPKKKNTLKEALKKLDSQRFLNLMKNRTVKMLHISVPKFRIDTSVDSLKSNLQSLGITEIFSESADLSGITNNLWVSDGIHKAMIETDEDGTVAAAVTLEYFNEMDGEPDPTYFTADHPFLFALTFKNHPLFLGVLNQ